ncbi:lytic transglycosylase domain-containing protein [Desulfocurvus sp. DL9XJH121]
MPRTMSAYLAGLALAAGLVLVPGPPACADMYFYRDENGAMHFTNRPSSTAYRVFAVFRNFPGAKREDILRVVRSRSRAHGVDHRLVQAVIQVESDFKPGAVSDKGAQGLMQLMPDTGRQMGMQKPFDLEQNIEAGVRYLKMQLDRFGSNALALAAYNAGPGAVERYGGIPPYKETQDYVRKVLSLYRKLTGGV